MKNQTILEWYRKNHEYIDAPCNGKGECGRCRVRFLSEAPKPQAKEEKLLTQEELEAGVRLACVAEKKNGDVFVVEENRSMADIYKVEYEWEPLQADSGQTYGVAIDIGTTTIAIRLVGLDGGMGTITVTAVNWQRAYGADVISRIEAANQGRLKELQICIRQELCGMLRHMLRDAGISVEQVKKIAIAGNTTMCHLLLGYSCEGLGKAPFTPVSLALTKLSAQALFKGAVYSQEEKVFLEKLQAEVIILPGISAFLGADVVAGMYACDMDMTEQPCMFLDVGTNGEMIIGSKHGFYGASTAAGPVFEGGNISCGMPAVKGAIAHVTSEKYEVLGDTVPQGVCGSGLVDLAAMMLKTHVIDENGTLCDAYFDSGYPVVDQVEKNHQKLKLTQADIRELQMGKAAIRAGMEVLMQREESERVYLAGGFGSALDIGSACEIGMFSRELSERIIPVGNAALDGVCKFLKDEQGEKRVTSITEKVQEILLAKEGDFEEKYILFMQFLL